jgi:hypothetical protein
MNKQEYQKLLFKVISPLKKYYSEGNARVRIGVEAAWYENISVETEAFARPLWGLVPFWAGGGSDADFDKIYANGLANGSDPESEEYWGECTDRDQRFVEMAAMAYGMLLAPEKAWEPLSDSAKNNLAAWLWQINEHEVCDSNWRFFRILVNIALKKRGMKYSESHIKSDLQRIDEFYLENGWYKDGVQNQKDYYVAFAIHFYSLIFAKFMNEDYPDYCEKFKQRANDFAKDFIYWFAEDGEALPYGRSLTYRFAQVAFWSACVYADVRPFPIGVIKGIIERNRSTWDESNMFDNANLLTIGYKYPNMFMAENYNALGSPYWGLKSLLVLALPDDHEYWSAEALPLPKLDALHPIKAADMIITRYDGEATAYVAGTHQNFACGQIVPKYLKFAYSTEFGFNVAKSYLSLEEAACDNMLCFVWDNLVLARRVTKEYEVLDDRIKVTWQIFDGFDVTTEIIPNEHGHERIHTIRSQHPCVAYDCGFAVASGSRDNCEISESGDRATAKNNFSSCTVIGGEGHVIHASPNTNIMYPRTVIPCVKYDVTPGEMVVKTTVITR